MRTALGFMQKATVMNEAMTLVQDANLLDVAQFRSLFLDAIIRRERFCGLAKSLMAIRGP